MLTQKVFPVFIFLLVSVLFFSCKKEEAEVFQSFDLEAKYENGAYQLSWTPTNISSFEEYDLVYKYDTDPLELDDENIPSARKKVLTDQTINTYTWEIPPNSEKILFQVYVLFDGRRINSNVVELENEETDVVDFLVDEVIHYPQKNALYFFYNNTNDMKYYDYELRETVLNRNLGFDYSAEAVGDNGLGEEIYLVRDATDIVVLDANTLMEKHTYYSGEVITSIATNEKGWLVLAINNNASKSIQIIERSTWEVTTELDYSIDDYLHGVAFLSKENNVLVESSRNNVYRYELDDEGELVNYTEAVNPYASESNNTNLVVSPTGNYFVNSRFGELFHHSLSEVIRMSNLTMKNYDHYIFGADGKDVYGIGSDFISHINKIEVETGVIEWIDFGNTIPHYLFLKGERVMMVTLRNNGEGIIRPIEY